MFRSRPLSLAILLAVAPLSASAAERADLLIRNATVHTASARGSLEHTGKFFMPPRRKTKKKRRRVAARVQVPRVCAPALARLLSGGHRSELRLTLGEAVKGLWAHARAHGLQDGREIRCDDYMRRLFDCDRLGMFDIAGALSKHMTGAAAAAGSAAGTARSGSAASHTLVTLSPALTSLLCGSANGGGGGPRELTVSHGEALRLLGKYITRRGLRDATDRRKIHCDAALAECALPPAPPAAPPCPNAVIRRTVARATPLSHYSLSLARARQYPGHVPLAPQAGWQGHVHDLRGQRTCRAPPHSGWGERQRWQRHQ